ncbi:MAG: helix-turn-helix transcriptional regulator [Clostridiales bacterium]|nr:helix-turn-helix transcriptional regulator [Clostridiales bacterium]
MDNLSIFVERLNEYMNEHGLNASTLAAAIKCSRVTVSGLLHKSHAPSTDILIALVEYFNCSADYLLGITEYPHITEFKPIKPFGDILRKCLVDSKKSEYRLRKDLEISSSLTYRWLTNKTVPQIDYLFRLRKYFGCSIDYLLGREN